MRLKNPYVFKVLRAKSINDPQNWIIFELCLYEQLHPYSLSHIRLLIAELIHVSEAVVLECDCVLTMVVKLLSCWVRESCLLDTLDNGCEGRSAVVWRISPCTCPSLAITLTRLSDHFPEP